mgnify:CR=1 FL=1
MGLPVRFHVQRFAVYYKVVARHVTKVRHSGPIAWLIHLGVLEALLALGLSPLRSYIASPVFENDTHFSIELFVAFFDLNFAID